MLKFPAKTHGICRAYTIFSPKQRVEHTGRNFVAGDPVFSVRALADERGPESDASTAVGARLACANVLVALVNVATLKCDQNQLICHPIQFLFEIHTLLLLRLSKG